MSEEWSDDDIARVIGNRAIAHLRTMYPKVYGATYPSCRLSLRNHIRNDIASLLEAMRVDGRMRNHIIMIWPESDIADEAAPTEPIALPAPPAPANGTEEKR